MTLTAPYSRIQQRPRSTVRQRASEMEGGNCCLRAAPAVLAHLSVLLAMYGGSMLATGARLKWDPTTYIAVRELLPEVYSACAALLPVAGASLVLMAHLAIAALTARSATTRRTLWLIYIACTVSLLAAEAVLGVWGSRQVQEFLRSDAAQKLRDTAEIKEHLLPLLATLERWLPLPAHIRELLQEAEVDLPWNGYIASGGAVVLLAVQLGALLTALLAWAGTPASPPTVLSYKGSYGAVVQHHTQADPGSR